MAFNDPTDTTLQFSGMRRMTLAEEGAQIEVRGPRRSWISSHQVRYDQIKAVYRYEMRDWGYVAVLALYWFGAFMVVSIASIVMRDPGYFLLVGTGVISVGIFLLGAYRILTAPKRFLRIDIVGQQPMILANRNNAFFYQLASRLPKSEPVAPEVIPPSVDAASEILPPPDPTISMDVPSPVDEATEA